MAGGDYKAAEIDVKAVLQVDPDNAAARLQLGKLYLDLQDGASAQKELERAYRLSADESIRPLLARALLLQSSYQQVTELTLPPYLAPADLVDLESSIGIAWLALGDLPRARSYINDALDLSGSTPYVRYAHAVALATEGEEEMAEQEMLDLLNSHPGYGRASALLGDLALRAGRFEEAEQHFSNAIANDQRNLNALLKRARVRVRLERYDLAEADLIELNGYLPGHPQINYLRGVMLYQQGDFEGAMTELEATLSMNPEHVAALFYSGTVNFLLGNFEVSEKRLREYLSYQPDYTPAKRMLAAISSAQHVIALDINGQSWSTEQLSRKLESWLQEGRNISLLVGGPDGLARPCLERAQQSWSLSPLTLPHPLVRVLLAEQLYRAWSVISGHPYHRS